MAIKYDFLTIAPVTPKGKFTICQRRIGSRDRFAPVAETRTQSAADSIVDALNLMQGEVKKLEVPAERLLEQVKGDLKIAHDKLRNVEAERSGLQHRLREAQRAQDNATEQRNIAQAKLQAAEAENNRLRAEFVEYRDKVARCPEAAVALTRMKEQA